MIKNGKINVLNALNVRKSTFPAYHFTYTFIPKVTANLVQKLDDWIYENLNGRYYIGTCIELVDNNIVYCIRLGFEHEKEISFFKIACPHV